MLPVVATPFDADGDIDVAALRDEVDWLFDNGADGITIAMVSEIQRLTPTERVELTAAVTAAVRHRGPVVASVGAESTRIARELAAAMTSCGADALMVAPPLLTAVNGRELASHVAEIASVTTLPLVVQDASGYVGAPIAARVQADLVCTYPPGRIMLKPEAVPIGPVITAIRTLVAEAALLFDGSGGIALMETHRRGAIGTMPGPDLVWAIRAIWDALEAQDSASAARVSDPLCALQSMVSSLDGYIAFEKHLLVRQGVIPHAYVRGPRGFIVDGVLTDLADAALARIRHAVDQPSPSV